MNKSNPSLIPGNVPAFVWTARASLRRRKAAWLAVPLPYLNVARALSRPHTLESPVSIIRPSLACPEGTIYRAQTSCT